MIYCFCPIKIDIQIFRNVCRGERFCVEYHIYNNEFLISISHVETFKFEDQSQIHAFYLSLLGTSTRGYQRGVTFIRRSEKYVDQFVIADSQLLKVLTSDSNLFKTQNLFFETLIIYYLFIIYYLKILRLFKSLI